MPKKTIIASAVVAVLGVAAIISFLGSEGALMERYPDYDPSDVKAAHRKMYLAALRGEFANVDTNDDSLMDHIFQSYVNNL